MPKGVPRTHGDWIAVSMTTVQAPGLTADDVLLNPFPDLYPLGGGTSLRDHCGVGRFLGSRRV